ncbi:MAG TPA: hypothetical protein VHI52_16500 [Verrucomicrobiae bacterium]|nr:hypothetical protein [Verrucomicrobiae bacterium]
MSTIELIILAEVAVLVILAAIFGVRLWRRSRITPAEWERRRRSALVATGKMGDANIVDVRDELLVYSYEVRGVEYTASQDVSMLKEYLPEDLSSAIGPIYVRYDAQNPANSIILAEEWSGLRSGLPHP